MKTLRNTLFLVLTLCLSTGAQAYRSPVLIWDSRAQTYREPTPTQARTLIQARSRGLSDGDLQQALGINPQGGEVSNAAKADYQVEIDSALLYTLQTGRLLVGPSLVLYRFNERLKLSVDAADEFLGLSVSHDFTSLLRPAVSVGIGQDLPERRSTAYISVRFRLW